ncbi:hypothetical protein AAHN97_15340 [Chitinophaga niabensis]|uniref:hypothetical protein n=1 Tax=Chitinophaga niabensis TaxID=536979 RepID=UPI0031BB06D3
MQLATDIYQRIAAARVFIDKNYYTSIDPEQIARQAFLSRFHPDFLPLPESKEQVLIALFSKINRIYNSSVVIDIDLSHLLMEICSKTP